MRSNTYQPRATYNDMLPWCRASAYLSRHILLD